MSHVATLTAIAAAWNACDTTVVCIAVKKWAAIMRTNAKNESSDPVNPKSASRSWRSRVSPSDADTPSRAAIGRMTSRPAAAGSAARVSAREGVFGSTTPPA